MKYQLKILIVLILEINTHVVIAQKIDYKEVIKESVTSMDSIPKRSNTTKWGDFSPLDSVPKWVQEKVTSEEYCLWKTMSSVFQINYSFLNRNFPLNKRDQFYDDIKQMCKLIEKGEYSNKKGELFSVSLPALVDTTLTWKVYELIQIDDNIQFCKRKSIIYSSEHWEKAYLECSIWYIYDIQKKDVDIIKYEISSPLPFSRFQGSVSFFLQNDKISLKGNCSGTMEYYDGKREYQSEDIYKSFIVPLCF